MTPEQIKAATEALTPLAEKLGTTVEYIYAVYRAYQWSYAVANLVTPLVVITLVSLSCVAIARWTWHHVHEATDGDDAMGWLLLGIFIGIFAIVAMFWIGGVAQDSYLRITNPDYYTIQSMLKLVGK